MTSPLRILVPGAGGPGTVNLCRSLRRAPEPVYLVGTDCDRAFSTLALCDEVHAVPPARTAEAYLEAISELGERTGVEVILPNNSLEIRPLSEHRARLRPRVFLPSPAALDLANSKWRSYLRWAEAGVPVPRTWLIEEPGDLERIFAEVSERPIWVRGAGIPGKGIGVASLPCREAAHAIAWVDHWRGWGGMIASEFLPGANLTWIGLFDSGRLVTSQGRQRDRYVIPHVSPSGITGAPAISHTVHRSDVHEIALRAARTIDPDLSGVVFVDMKGDSEDRPRVTEINAGRFGTTHFFYTAAGLNLPWLTVLLALGRPVPEVPIRDPLPADLYWIRTLDAGPVLIRGVDLRGGRTQAGQRFGLFGEPSGSPPPLDIRACAAL